MLNREERNLVYQQAYLPEHLPDYVEAVSGAEAHLHGGYLCFTLKNHLIFVGYPLGNVSGEPSGVYESACKHFRPNTVAIIAPEIWRLAQNYEGQPADTYYRLDLPVASLDPEVAYMVRRASRELRVTSGTFGKEHIRLVNEFLSRHQLTQKQIEIFKRIPLYLKGSKTANLLEARKGTHLVAFTIVDMGAAHYAFYLFNFRSNKKYVPGASDFLFHEMVRLAQAEGKDALNLGLGIHPGVLRFKEKWGGTPFLTHASAFISTRPFELGRLADKL